MVFIRFILSFTLGMLLTTLPNAYATDAPILNFGDLLQQPIGPQGLVIAPTAKRMQGQSVRMRGFMVKSEEDAIGQFYFAPMPYKWGSTLTAPPTVHQPPLFLGSWVQAKPPGQFPIKPVP